MRSVFDLAVPIVRTLAAVPGRVIPYPAQKRLLAPVLNEAFRASLARGDLDFLTGATIRIRVSDLYVDWLLTVNDGKFLPLDRVRPEDVCISGDSVAFALLAARRADPDTLFFQRRIRVQGDTELGLGVKNTMDSMDWDDLPPPLRHLLQTLGTLFDRFGAHGAGLA